MNPSFSSARGTLIIIAIAAFCASTAIADTTTDTAQRTWVAHPGQASIPVRFTPDTSLTFAQVTTLASTYASTVGGCDGGVLHWSVQVGPRAGVRISYRAPAGLASCTGPAAPSGRTTVGMADLRYDTSQLAGGTVDDTYDHALSLVGSTPVLRASLAVDPGRGTTPSAPR